MQSLRVNIFRNNTYGVSYLIRDKPEILKERTKDLEEHAKKIEEIVKNN